MLPRERSGSLRERMMAGAKRAGRRLRGRRSRDVNPGLLENAKVVLGEPTSLGDLSMLPSPPPRNPTLSFVAPPAASLVPSSIPRHAPTSRPPNRPGASDPAARAWGHLLEEPSTLRPIEAPERAGLLRIDRILLVAALASLLVVLLATMLFADFFNSAAAQTDQDPGAPAPRSARSARSSLPGEVGQPGEVADRGGECPGEAEPVNAVPARLSSVHGGAVDDDSDRSLRGRSPAARDMVALSLNIDVYPKNAMLQIRSVPGGYAVRASAEGYQTVRRVVPDDFPGTFMIRLEPAPIAAATPSAPTSIGTVVSRARSRPGRAKERGTEVRPGRSEVFLKGDDL